MMPPVAREADSRQRDLLEMTIRFVINRRTLGSRKAHNETCGGNQEVGRPMVVAVARRVEVVVQEAMEVLGIRSARGGQLMGTPKTKSSED